MKTLLGFIALATLIGCKNNDGMVHSSLKYVSYGVVCYATGGTIHHNQNAIDGQALFDQNHAFSVDQETYEVLAQLQSSFGVIIENTAATATNLFQASISHPPMGPKGLREQTWQVSVEAGDQVYVGYRLEETMELVPGTWTLRLHDGEALRLEKSFTLYDPKASNLPETSC